VALPGEEGQFCAVGGGGGEFFGRFAGDDVIPRAVEKANVGGGFPDGVQRAARVGVEAGEAAHGVDDGEIIGGGHEQTGQGQQVFAEVGGLLAQGGEGGDGDDGGDAGIAAGEEDGAGGAVRRTEDADGGAAEVVFLEIGGELGQVVGVIDAVGDVVGGRFAVAGEVHEDGAIAGALEGLGGAFHLVMVGDEAMEDEDGALGGKHGFEDPEGEGGLGRADGEEDFIGGEAGGVRSGAPVGGCDEALGEEVVAA